MQVIQRFGKRYGRHLWHLEWEEWLGWLTRFWPGFSGLVIRGLVCRLLCPDTRGLVLVYPGAFLTHTYGLHFGRACSINSGALLDGRGGITIGNGVMIGPHVVIVSSHHQAEQTEQPMAAVDHMMTPVVIEDDVWIGAHAVIRGGVTIRQGAVIGAGAVVVRDVGEYEIVGGVPARLLGNRRGNTVSSGGQGDIA
jgi:maltose O-acetyltransferase